MHNEYLVKCLFNMISSKDGAIVSIWQWRYIYQSESISQNSPLSLSFYRTLAHPNVAVLYGCLVGETKSAFLHAYSSRGTLHNVLNNTELQLDWVFSLSFGLDAAEAMTYLHSRKIIHGRLKTTTCIINEQWTLKIKGIEVIPSFKTPCS